MHHLFFELEITLYLLMTKKELQQLKKEISVMEISAQYRAYLDLLLSMHEFGDPKSIQTQLLALLASMDDEHVAMLIRNRLLLIENVLDQNKQRVYALVEANEQYLTSQQDERYHVMHHLTMIRMDRYYPLNTVQHHLQALVLINDQSYAAYPRVHAKVDLQLSLSYIVHQHDIVEGLQYMLHSLENFIASNHTLGTVLTQNYIGGIYCDKLRNYQEALRYLKPNLDLLVRNDCEVELKLMSNQVLIPMLESYLQLGDNKAANEVFQAFQTYNQTLQPLDSSDVMQISRYFTYKMESVKRMRETHFFDSVFAFYQSLSNYVFTMYTHIDVHIFLFTMHCALENNQYERAKQVYEEQAIVWKRYGCKYEFEAVSALANYAYEHQQYELAAKWYQLAEGLLHEDLASSLDENRLEHLHKTNEWEIGQEVLTELTLTNSEIEESSHTDHLTKLYNRRYLKKIVDTNQVHASIGYLLIDVDYFKAYNDHYGHLAGDRVLQQLGEVLARFNNNEDQFVFRYGGEEFLIFAIDKTAEEMTTLATKIQNCVVDLDIPHAHSLVREHLTISLGLVLAHHQCRSDSKDLIPLADIALYQAKEFGRNQYQWFKQPA
ncbi:MAG: GGDEF domain-containing protein [Erysipelotrichaceae bacterium]